MKDPIVKRVDEILEDSSIPEIVEALVVIAKHYKKQLQREGNSEWQGWARIEAVMAKALKEID